MPDLNGQTIAGYPLEKKLGDGAYGAVYQAQTSAEPLRVIVLREDLRADANLNEAVATSWEKVGELIHPNLVHMYGCGVDAMAGAYCLEEGLRSKSLRQIIGGGMNVAWRDVLQLAGEMAQGLKALHDAGLVHGDLWPGHVQVTQDQDVKLEGAGALVQAPRAYTELIQGPALGYAAPERLQGAPASPGADLYSLGACLYFILAAQHPFPGGEDAALMRAVREKEPAPVSAFRDDVPETGGELITRLMAKDPTRRYARAGDVLADLAALRNGQPLAPLKGGPAARIPPQAALAASSSAPPAPPTPPVPEAAAVPASGPSKVAALPSGENTPGEKKPVPRRLSMPSSDFRIDEGRAKPRMTVSVTGKLKTHVRSTIPHSSLEKTGDNKFTRGLLAAAVADWKEAWKSGAQHAALRAKIELGESKLTKQTYLNAMSAAEFCLNRGDFEGALAQAREAYQAAPIEPQRILAQKLEEQTRQRAAEARKFGELKHLALLALGSLLVLLFLAWALKMLIRSSGPESHPPPSAPAPRIEPSAPGSTPASKPLESGGAPAG